MKKGKRKTMGIVCLTVVIVLVVAVLVILPPSKGEAPEFKDENGEVLANSISEKIHVDINGTSLGMFIMGKNEDAPVLLFLGGGPGIPEFFLEQEYPSGLADEFVVCYLEYRGCSLSYDANQSLQDMTTKQYVSDVVEVTKYLQERFHQEKIYLMGHSFGTSIGLRTVKEHPEYYHAYIAMAQGADQMRSEEMAYDYMIDWYAQQGDDKMVQKLKSYAIKGSYETWKEYCRALRDKAMHQCGVGSTRDMKSVISGIFFPILRCKVYTPMERINVWRGKAFLAQSEVVDDSFQFNAFEEVPEVELPYYIFAGKYDYTCCYDVQKEYFEAVKAPKKKFYTFENSAHSPLFEEPEKAMQILREEVLEK